jgi:hypothetical protein
VRGNTDRLVDNHDVVVLVHDAETGHALGRGDGGFSGRGQLDVEPGPATDTVRAVPAYAVQGHRPRVDKLGGGGSGQSEQARDSHIKAQPVEAVGYRDPTPVGRR